MTPAITFAYAVTSHLARAELQWLVGIAVGEEQIEQMDRQLRAGEIHGFVAIIDSDAGPLVERRAIVDELCAVIDAAVDAASADIGRMPLELTSRGAA